jgi:hypothetical protein
MSWPLPPKRFESVLSHKFDQIRGRPWFKRLERRKWQLNGLQLAFKKLSNGLGTQQGAAKEFGVDPRELRDYVKFIRGHHEKPSPTFQQVLNGAYDNYCRHSAEHGIRHYIELEAPFYGVNPRQVVELWETHPTFYPMGYKFTA